MIMSCPPQLEQTFNIAIFCFISPAIILNSITLSAIIYHRQRLKQYHIFPFNIILANCVASISFGVVEVVRLAEVNNNECFDSDVKKVSLAVKFKFVTSNRFRV